MDAERESSRSLADVSKVAGAQAGSRAAERKVVTWSFASEGKPIATTLPMWALLISAIINGIATILASIFAWIAYRRGAADQILKEWQIVKLKLEIEKLRLEMKSAGSDAARSEGEVSHSCMAV